jgi:glycosyltransferase involved in cell wall biosynthesis
MLVGRSVSAAPAQQGSSFCLNSQIGDHLSLGWVGASIVHAAELLGHRPLLQAHRSIRTTDFPSSIKGALDRYRQLSKQGTPTVDRVLNFGRYARQEQVVRAKRKDVLVFWDSDTLSDSMAQTLSRFDNIYGISSFVANVIADRTGREDQVFNHGIWPDFSPYTPPPATGPFTFLHLGTVNPRKATDLLFRAFALAFPPSRRDDVRLLVKCGMDSVAQAAAWRRDFAADDPRIVIDGQHVSRRDLSRYYAAAHVVAMPSRCEGFGLVGLEALAHGRTVIASGWSGPGDYLASNDCIILPTERNVPAYGYPGFAREIDLRVLAEALQVAAFNVERTSSLGRVGRERVLQDWNWTDKCHSYLNS